ncbi:MAG: type II toxin-antitoxin system HipA family toxin [Alloalcanivorax sp.]
MIRQRYDLYLNTRQTGIVHAAEVVLLEESGFLTRVGFRYRPDYLNHRLAFPLDPVQLPLRAAAFEFECHRGASPAFLDDYLPDDWGRKVLVQLALLRDKKALNAHSIIDTLAMLGHSRVGALSLVVQGEAPRFDAGHAIEHLRAAEQAAQQIDQMDFGSVAPDEMSLVYLANAGTGVGGARPKALLFDDAGQYLAKFNRITQDRYNNARVELACLRMAQAAGIHMKGGKIIEGINGREVLLLERFDIDGQARKHLITVNGLLKEPASQMDLGHAFRYDHVCDLVKKYSCRVEEDLTQLLKLMLFNRGINNTDDHERNFSLMHSEQGYHLAPAYDLVPSLTINMHHAASYQYQAYPPTPTEALQAGRIFSLPQSKVQKAAREVISAVERWQEFASVAGVSGEDAEKVSRVIRL